MQISSKIVLASASPTRRKILENAGFRPQVWASNFDESSIQLSDPAELVKQLAQAKAEEVAKHYPNAAALIVGCDSIMWLNNQIFGKPNSRAQAIATWDKMRGGKAIIYSGHCLIDIKQQRIRTEFASTVVYFVNASDREIGSYVDSGEPMNCAGCFTLEGLGGLLIEKIEGCHTNVLGLSLPLFRKMLRELGYSIRFGSDRLIELQN
jgi:septum formation protein